MHRRVLEVVAFGADPRQAQHGELAGGEAPLELLELGGADRAVGDVRLHAVALASVWASWRRHQTRSANTITCSSAATPASVCAVIPRSSGSPSPPPRIASATSPWRTSALASAACEWVSVSGSTLASTIDAHVAQHDALGSGELGERLLEQLAAGLEAS